MYTEVDRRKGMWREICQMTHTVFFGGVRLFFACKAFQTQGYLLFHHLELYPGPEQKIPLFWH